MRKPTVIELDTEERPRGKKSVQKLRQNGLIPSVLYGPKVEKNLHFAVPELELEKVLSAQTTHIIKFKFDNGESYDTLLKSTQIHPVTDRVIHADFYALDEETEVLLTVPIRLTGSAPGVVEGGRLYQPMRKIRVRCKPSSIPAEFTLDVGKLNIADSLNVDQLTMEGIIPLAEEDRTVVTIRPPKGALEDILGTAEEEELEEGEEGAEAAESGETEGGEESGSGGEEEQDKSGE